MPQFTFTIPIPMPLVSDNSRGWRKVARGRKAMREWVYMLALQERKRHGLPPASERRGIKLTLLRGARQQLLDVSNLDSNLKAFLDSLTSPNGRSPFGAAWLVDDSPKWCDYQRTDQVIDREHGPAVVVHIWWPVEEAHGRPRSADPAV